MKKQPGSRMSLKAKLMFSSVPMVAIMGVVSYQIYHLIATEDGDLRRVNDMILTADDASEQMVRMSEALRGYLMDPSNKAELARKKEADKAFSVAIERLTELAKNDAEINSLREEMSKFDEEKLDPAENYVAEMASTRGAGVAQEVYRSKYLPLRRVQEKRVEQLRELVKAHAESARQQMAARDQRDAWSAILMIIAALSIGLGATFWVVSNNSKSLVGETEQLANAGDSLQVTCKEIGVASEELSQATTEQAAAIQESVSALAEMTSMIQQTGEGAKRSLQTSRTVEERSQVGQDIMKRMVDSMAAIEQANQSLQQIGQIIQAINVKAGVINDIVFKTQLLSFNASIEAARAGQYGKGFSVVAEEVGNLAQMSGASAREIESLLADSQKKVSTTLDLIRQRVSESKIVTDESVRTFNEIADSIRDITSQIKTISDATTQQSVGIEQTQKALSQLDQMARKNAETAQATLKAASSLKDVSSKVNGSRKMIQVLVEGASLTASVPLATAESMPQVGGVFAQVQGSEPLEQKHKAPSLALVEHSETLPPTDLSAEDESFRKAA